MYHRRNTTLALCILCASLVVGAATAQTETSPSAASPEETLSSKYRRVEELQDAKVVNAIGDEVGDVAGLIVSGSEITHVVIGIGGFLGMGGSEVVVPFDLMTFDGEQATIETIASSDQIQSLVPFDPVEFGLSE